MQGITRRDFVNGVAMGVGSALLGRPAPAFARPAVPQTPSLGLDWYGYGGVGDYASSHGNTPEAVETAHRLRAGAFDRLPAARGPVERYDLVIVGGGFAGLGAALEFSKKRKPGQVCLLLDNHPVFGGEAKENEFNVSGTRLISPQGSNGFFLPAPVSDPSQATGDERYYAELEIPRQLRYREWPADRKPLGFSRDNYEYLVRGFEDRVSVGHFYEPADRPGGHWVVDIWRNELAGTPLPEPTRRMLVAWHRMGATRTFSTEQEAMRVLDAMSYKLYLERELAIGPEAAAHADLFLASACGLGSDAVSAFIAYVFGMPGLSDGFERTRLRESFPGGNSGFARYFLKRLIPDSIGGKDSLADIITGRINFAALDRAGQPVRVRLGSTAVHVAHDGEAGSAPGVTIVYSRGGQLHTVKASAVVMATGAWINRFVVRDLPPSHREAFGRFRHAAFLVANVALTNWRFLEKLGITAAIWNKGNEDFGYTCNIRNPMIVGDYQPPLDPDRPTVLSFYTPFFYPGLPIDAQLSRGRAELLQTSYAEYERRILRQMAKLFGSAGFQAQRDVAGIILNRWGHAYSVPFPGFYGGVAGTAPRDVVRQHYGRIAFGHSELVGWQHWGPAADEGRRAMNQVFGAI